jgi:hypothetical protein
LHGIDPATASQLAQAYETIAKDKCSPKLTITCETIDPRLLNGKMLLAVNVDAVPDQLVGAMFYAVDKNGGVKKRFGHVNGSTRMHAASMALRERPPIEPARARARAGRRLSEEAPGIIGLLERPLLTDEEAARLVVSVKSACCNCSRAAACASL